MKPSWFYDEIKHCGVDYGDPAQVAEYDNRHRKFRDYQKDTDAIIDAIGIKPEHTVIDMGVGTGAFSLHAAKYCKTIFAADVSPAMLDHSRGKARELGITNIVFCQGGFLSYVHNAAPVDAVISIAALHHLPDFWKLMALRRVHRMLVSGGRFYLFDVVFPSDSKDLDIRIEEWRTAMNVTVGHEFAQEIDVHIREEYSTYDFVMEGFLGRAGFRIDKTSYADGFGATYLCTKPM
jgi:putative AdoMet-dependent methyltransferase